MPDEKSPSQLVAHRVGPPVLLGLRPRFMERAVKAAQRDERIRALSLWGSLARGDADEWSGVEFVATVSDELVPEVLEELSRKDSAFGQTWITLRMPQNGVDGGGFLSMTYYQSTLPIHVEWYVCPLSLGVPTADTNTLFLRDGWPKSRTSFAELLRDRPSQQSFTPPHWDLFASMIPIHVKDVVRGRPEVVLVGDKPASDPIEAYDELARRIASLPATHSDLRAPLFYLLGIARRGC
jgi:hypothetical protein